MPKIESIYVFIATDEDPEDEGVVAQLLGDTWFPLVAADQARVKFLRPLAKRIAEGTKKTVVLAKFSHREDLEEIQGGRETDKSGHQ